MSAPQKPAQLEINGAAPSAIQLAKGREASGHGRIRPKKPQADLMTGLFAPPPDPGLFD